MQRVIERNDEDGILIVEIIEEPAPRPVASIFTESARQQLIDMADQS